jgi:uncharacterized protein YgbK (DUF1537 family)
MKTVVLDDDPTGTQFATGVRVLLEWDAQTIADSLMEVDALYIQTNSRSISEEKAVKLSQQIKSETETASKIIGQTINFILRGDSTLRGHVFAETNVFVGPNSKVLFVPAYPDIGRTTLDGTHRVKIEGVDMPAHETEFASDPVFPFSTSLLTDYVSEKSDRQGTLIPLNIVRSGTKNLAESFLAIPNGVVILPDVETNEDIRSIADAANLLREGGISVVVRCAAPLAAMMVGVDSKKLLSGPIITEPFSVLLAAGSHTAGATSQLTEVSQKYLPAVVISTSEAMEDPIACGEKAGFAVLSQVNKSHFGFITTERNRLPEHNTLEHGEKVMEALICAVNQIVPSVDVVIAKGGITSADVARKGIGAKSGWVLGQILPGISLWKIEDKKGRSLYYVVVPGNVGDSGTLVSVLQILGFAKLR